MSTEGILQLIALRINKSSSEVVQLLRKMKNELEGKVRHNVIPNSEKQKITEVFQGLNLMTWESFVKNRLPLLNLPKEIKAVLVQGFPYFSPPFRLPFPNIFFFLQLRNHFKTLHLREKINK